MKKKYIYSILAALFLALTAIIFFSPDVFEGNVLQQHDIMQGTANGQEAIAYNEKTGDTTRWTNSLFGGMPNFQIAPSYPAGKAISWIGKAFSLWLPDPTGLLFSMMLGFFILCLCLKFKWYTALFASIAWGFSSYFIILIGAGHIWKFVTLAYIPPTIGGIVLCYRGRYLGGTALAALFGALQLQSNHPQMSYYFLFVIAAMVLAWLYTAIKKGKTREWLCATGCIIVAGSLAVAANSASLYNSYEYSKETVRGRATELTPREGAETGGMDRSAITAWSYGVDETFTLMIPNVKGGATIKPEAGESKLMSLADTPKASDLILAPEELQFIGQFPQYFGDQPMTNGPVYVGVFVLLLAIIAIFTVQSPMKWALLAVSILAVMLSWGHNFSLLTDLFIDHFPAYNKFRAVSSILVIVEFTVPLLAALCLKKILDTDDFLKKYKAAVWGTIGVGALICFLGWISPSIFGEPFSTQESQYLAEAGAYSNPAYYNVVNAIKETRLALVSADSLRSLIFVILGAAILFLYGKGYIKSKPVFVCLLAAVSLIDLYTVGKRYVNHDNFTAAVDNETALQKTSLDEQILQDTAMNYRVFDVPGISSARSSYFHKTIGGYHAAKLTRYNDLLTNQISKGNMGVINMLNAKYIMTQDSVALNPGALGNAWLVSELKYVNNADEEMAALDSLDTSVAAVADVKFKETLGEASLPVPGDTIFETSYAPNRLTYHVNTANGGVALFSEVFFPWGWTATIDGREAPIGRANYVLRALRIPAGAHAVEFKFDPQSLKTTNTISMIGVGAIYILILLALIVFAIKTRKGENEESKE